jgi:hypothetical protein
MLIEQAMSARELGRVVSAAAAAEAADAAAAAAEPQQQLRLVLETVVVVGRLRRALAASKIDSRGRIDSQSSPPVLETVRAVRSARALAGLLDAGARGAAGTTEGSGGGGGGPRARDVGKSQPKWWERVGALLHEAALVGENPPGLHDLTQEEDVDVDVDVRGWSRAAVPYLRDVNINDQKSGLTEIYLRFGEAVRSIMPRSRCTPSGPRSRRLGGCCRRPCGSCAPGSGRSCPRAWTPTATACWCARRFHFCVARFH